MVYLLWLYAVFGAVSFLGYAAGLYFHWRYGPLKPARAHVQQHVRLDAAAIAKAVSTGCSVITDPTRYHRDRINEALGFEGGLDAIQNLGGVIADLEHAPEPDTVAIRTLRRVQGQLYAVRDLCAEGDRT